MPTLTTLLGNSQRLDGGAMFGNAPKALWSQWVDVDERNHILLACRALLVEFAHKKVLFETGIGAFFPPKLKQRYGIVEQHHVLLDSLAQLGLAHTDIDVVVLSHLHFDHAGGLLSAWQDGQAATLLFPRATYVVSRAAWQRTCAPHPRDHASFIPELPDLLTRSDRLEIVEGERASVLGDDVRFWLSEGHTPGLMLAEIAMPAGPVVFASDLIPATPWIHLPITMGYDRYPEHLIDEKRQLLDYLVEQQGRIVYTHDPNVAISGVARDTRGRFTPIDTYSDVRGLKI